MIFISIKFPFIIFCFKYNFNIIDASKNKDYYINENLLFKIIDIEPTRKLEKPKTLFLDLCDEDEEIEQEVSY